MENGVASLVRRSTPLLFPDFRVTSDYNDSYVLDLALVLSWAAPSLLTLSSLKKPGQYWDSSTLKPGSKLSLLSGVSWPHFPNPA